MMRRLAVLRRDRRGISAVEFAIIAPLLVLLIVGIAQMGILYFAHAGLRNLVAEGARFASTYPRPPESAIKARLERGGFGLVPERLGTPSVTYGRTGGADWADIQLDYTVRLNFIFWSTPVDLSEQRRVFIYAAG